VQFIPVQGVFCTLEDGGSAAGVNTSAGSGARLMEQVCYFLFLQIEDAKRLQVRDSNALSSSIVHCLYIESANSS
jgi:hypothetical protein